MTNQIDALVTPAWLTFVDHNGRKWRALALVAPLRSEDMEPVQFALTEDLELVPTDCVIVRK